MTLDYSTLDRIVDLYEDTFDQEAEIGYTNEDAIYIQPAGDESKPFLELDMGMKEICMSIENFTALLDNLE